MQFEAGITANALHNERKTAKEYLLEMDFQWGINRRWRLTDGWQLAAGATAGFDVGVIYLPRNGNNPASAKADVSLSLRGSASKRLTIWSLPVLVTETVSLPSLSAFFSPQYGEPYYEIYLGNHSGLAHCGWWGNHFRLNNLITADMDFGRTALRIGYGFNINTSYVNDLNTQIITHSFVIGVIPHGLGLRKMPTEKTVRINALY